MTGKEFNDRYLALLATYNKLLKEYEEKQNNGEQLTPDVLIHLTEALKICRAIIQGFEKICHILENIKDESLKPHMSDVSMALVSIEIMNISFEDYSKITDQQLDDKAKRLAELLFGCLADEQKNSDNPITFLSKMKVFPRTTTLSKVDTSIPANQRKIIELTLKKLGDKYMVAISDIRNTGIAQNQAQLQTMLALQQKAILAYSCLRDFCIINPSTTNKKVKEDAEGIILHLHQNTRKISNSSPVVLKHKA